MPLSIFIYLIEEFYVGVRNSKNYKRDQHFGGWHDVSQCSVELKIVHENKNRNSTQQKTNITDNGIFEALSRYYTHKVVLNVFRYKNNIVDILSFIFFVVCILQYDFFGKRFQCEAVSVEIFGFISPAYHF